MSSEERESVAATTSLREFSRLSTPEKILLLEDLWDHVAAEPDEVPVPRSHRDELDARLARHETGRGTLLTLSELHARLRKRKR